MKILRAEHLGMCFGVRDAIALAHEQARLGPLTVLGDLVHNRTVIDDLQSRGIQIAQRPEEVMTRHVMVTAHGASDQAKARARARGLNVIEATCPLVHLVHHALTRLVNNGFHPVIVGKRDHVEVRGLTGDLAEYDVVLNKADVERMTARPRFGVVAQTTQPVSRVRYLVQLVQQRFPDAAVRFVDTVCRPTKQRQHAAVELAQHCDVIVVIGGTNSNNTRELVATSLRHCARVHHVQTAEDLRGEWFYDDDMVGITAGTSTPDAVIEGVEIRLRRFAAEKEVLLSRQGQNQALTKVELHTTLNHC